MFEGLSRPFTSPLGTQPGPKIAPAIGGEDGGVSIIRWGIAGDMPTPAATTTPNCMVKATETSRQSSQVRIENPNDSSQYVIVERPDELDLDSQETDPVYQWRDPTAYVAPNLSMFSGAIQAMFSQVAPGSTTKECKVSVYLDNGPSTA